MKPTLSQRLTSEALGTAFLLAMVVGSGIMAERLAGGNMGVALLANTLATGAGLVALMLAFAPISAQFNPVVTLIAAAQKEMPWRDVPSYVAVQCVGALAGVAAAHLMFGHALFAASTKIRASVGEMFAEAVATFGLLLVIASVAKHRANALPYAVAAYITAAYWFTSSTSFANPAVTLARAVTESFAGIRPADAPAFMLAQLAGMVVAIVVIRFLFGTQVADSRKRERV